MAPRARFELATLRLTAEIVKIQSAPFGVACKQMGGILPSLVAPNAAPKPICSNAAFCSTKRLKPNGLERLNRRFAI